MLLSDFDYHLPDELIAQQPLPDRAASRMLVVDRATGTWEDRLFRQLPSYIAPGDCMVLNDSRVFPSRLYGRREHGTGRVEVFLTRQVSPDGLTWEALVRPGRKMRSGEKIIVGDELSVQILGRGESSRSGRRACARSKARRDRESPISSSPLDFVSGARARC